MKTDHPLTEEKVSRIIEMAWEDRTPFEAIEQQFQLNEADVIKLMRSSKHTALRSPEISRAYCATQYKHK
jgi:hypothetical protein